MREFNYLGVIFSDTGLFRHMIDSKVHASNSVIGSCINLINKIQTNSWTLISEIFNSLVLSSTTYCACVWSLRYQDELERIQLKFFKRILHLPSNTPNYAVRLESDILSTEFYVFKSAIGELCRLHSMPNDRLPKLCWFRLMDLAKNRKTSLVNYGKSIFEN